MAYEDVNLDFLAFSFDEVKNALKTQLEEDGVIKDYAYEGSNINSLLNILAYTQMLLNHNISFLAGEQFLQTCTLRKNILKHAKTLKYRVQRKISSKIDLTLSVALKANERVFIPKFTQITPTEGDGTKFVILEDILIANTTGQENIFSYDIIAKEGIIITKDSEKSFSFSYNGEDNLVLPLLDIEDEGIFITISKQDGRIVTFEEYRYGKNFTDGNVFIADTDPDTGYVIMSKDIDLLKKPDLNIGDKIDIKVLQSKGYAGNGYSSFKNLSIDDKTVFVNISETSEFKKSYGGYDEESSDSIKKYAPLYHSSGERAVTKNDWMSIAANHSIIEQSYAWGGEEYTKDINIASQSFIYNNEEVQAMKKIGDVFLTGIKSGSVVSTPTYFNNAEIVSFLDSLSRYCIMGVRRNFVQPVYCKLNVYVEAYISSDPKYTVSDIQTNIVDAINTYFDDQNKYFLRTFIYSKLINKLYDIDGIISIDAKWSDKVPSVPAGTNVYSTLKLELTKNIFHALDSYKDFVLLDLPLLANKDPLDRIKGEYGNLKISSGPLDEYELEFAEYTGVGGDVPQYYKFYHEYSNVLNPYDAANSAELYYLGDWKTVVKKIIYTFPTIVDTEHPHFAYSGKKLLIGEFNAKWNQFAFFNAKITKIVGESTQLHAQDIFLDYTSHINIFLTNKNAGEYFDLTYLDTTKEIVLIPGEINLNVNRLSIEV